MTGGIEAVGSIVEGGLFARALADRFEIDALGRALRQGESAREDGQSERDQEMASGHSAQQFRLRQTRYPMSSPMAGTTCPGD